MGPVNNIPALVQVMAGRRYDENTLFEPMAISLLTRVHQSDV